ncbi:MerR family transcriptional regulator [Bifidobacterium aquikefiri]|uniref:MerR family transcriptional regulator n=1 Tax=Bifidobacterium aquikefiri TaxID=1653207 RepID=A0A261G0J6_9BIFI|nr:MerR family transcriptional regulator [Bifidobacterium aquikefiri]
MQKITRDLRQMYIICAHSLVDGRLDLDNVEDSGFDSDLPVFTVGKVATLAKIHPQTLRQYDRLGLVVPKRTRGGARRYSLRDIDRLCQAQHLSQDESINLAGVTRILALQEENRQLRREIRRMRVPSGSSVFAAGRNGEVIEVQRSERARLWRHETHRNDEELVAFDETDELGSSRSLIIWGSDQEF